MKVKKKQTAPLQSVINVILNLRECNWSVQPKNHRRSGKWFEFLNTIRIPTICYVEENVYYQG